MNNQTVTLIIKKMQLAKLMHVMTLIFSSTRMTLSHKYCQRIILKSQLLLLTFYDFTMLCFDIRSANNKLILLGMTFNCTSESVTTNKLIFLKSYQLNYLTIACATSEHTLRLSTVFFLNFTIKH